MSDQLSWWKRAIRKVNTRWLAGVGVGLLLVLSFSLGRGWIHLSFGAAEEPSTGDAKLEGETPAEFLLLDTTRIDSYLAQLTEGTEASKKLGEKLTKSASAGIDKVVKAQGELKEENFVEREVTPTASSRLIELEEELDAENQLEDLTGDDSNSSDGHGTVEEGEVVKLTAAVRAPQYVEPYLAVSHEATVSALFPNPSRDMAKREVIEARRRAAWKFRRQIGKDPRIVLAVSPESDWWSQSHRVLMPLHMLQLSEERSLLRTSGTFTVLGKVVRFFLPQKEVEDGKRPNSYVDAPTLHTWLHPLRNAPDELVCRANLTCATKVEALSGPKGKLRHELVKEARDSMIKSLIDETRIKKAGGFLIVPLAIYR